MAVENEKELYAGLSLVCSSELPLRRVVKCVKNSGSIESTLETLWENPALLRKPLNPPNPKKIESCMSWLQGGKNRFIIPFTDTRYPLLLKEIAVPPLVLFVEGSIELLTTPQLAIVGSRNATPAAQEIAYRLASELATKGLTITSGLARGIDGAAHQGALAVKGKTSGVTATGIDGCYPLSHRTLFNSLREQGLLISEFIPGTAPLAAYFPQRNRIISGLSLGVLVVEASLRSGSLVTARFALEQGREVFAIPGSVHNPLSQGCHALLKQGAMLVENAEDILTASPFSQHIQIAKVPKNKVQSKNSPESMAGSLLTVLNCVDFSATSFDTILYRSHLSQTDVNHALLMLELEGHITLSVGGYTRMVMEKA